MAECQASDSDAGLRLDQFLAMRLPEYSRARLQGWIEAGRVKLNGKPAGKASLKLRGGERIEVEPAELTPLHAFAEQIPLEILYEDNDLVAVNKPAGLVVHAGAGRASGTLVNALLHHFKSLSSVGGDLRPGIVHRLDKGTSGIILVARTDAAHRSLAAQFANRTVEKTYLALVQGKPISRDPERRTRMTARLASGRHAHTEYRVLERYAKFSLLEVLIGTGRTHQIRVHLAAVGHPVAGDSLYGAAAQPDLDRPWLHALRVRFASPSTGERLSLEAPVTPELLAWKARLSS